jgi:hypothetical protein
MQDKLLHGWKWITSGSGLKRTRAREVLGDHVSLVAFAGARTGRVKMWLSSRQAVLAANKTHVSSAHSLGRGHRYSNVASGNGVLKATGVAAVTEPSAEETSDPFRVNGGDDVI